MSKQYKTKYQLSINEAMMYCIQQATGDSATKITSYFYDIMTKQCKLLDKKPLGDRHNSLSFPTKTNYDYYPNTSVYFAITTQKSLKDEVEHNYWVYITNYNCSVSLPSKAVKLDDKKLKEFIAESILLGDEAGADILPPHNKNKRATSNHVGKLDDPTDPKGSSEEKEDD